MTSLPHRLDRTILIGASPETVFSFFTDTARWAAWWGPGLTIDPRRGGRVFIRYPNGIEATGELLDLAPPDRVSFTFGYPSGSPIPTGGSRVTIQLDAHPDGTRLQLTHEFADGDMRDQFVQGWRYQLSLLANAVADLANRNAAALVDRWFQVWVEPREAERAVLFDAIVEPDIRYRDRFSAVDGRADLDPHIAAAQRFMPGVTLTRSGEVRHCQGTVLADWHATGPDGAARGRGTNVFVIAPTGRLASVTGFWS